MKTSAQPFPRTCKEDPCYSLGQNSGYTELCKILDIQRYRLKKNSGSFQSKCFLNSNRNVLFSFTSGKTCYRHRKNTRYMHSYLFLCAMMIALIEDRKITLVHTQNDNLACIFSMVFQAMHFMVRMTSVIKPPVFVHQWLSALIR